MEAMLETLKQLLTEEALIYVPIAMLIGAYIKNFTKLDNKFIPPILVVVSLLGMGAKLSLLDRFTVVGTIEQGIIVAGVAVLTHTILTKSFDKE